MHKSCVLVYKIRIKYPNSYFVLVMIPMESTDKDKERAKLFDALGHPTRIAVLNALNEKPLGFSELKRKLSIDSSGHLLHHLNKLDDLIKTDEHGKYCLSDQGRDALFVIKTVEWASKPEVKEANARIINKWKRAAAILLVALILVTIPLTNFYLAAVREKNEILRSLDAAASEQLFEIRSDIDILLYLLEYNNSTDTIKYKAEALNNRADTIICLTRELWHYTGDSKCYNLHRIFDDLYWFINSVLSTCPPNETIPQLMVNNGTLKEMSSILEEMSVYVKQDRSIRAIPDTLIEELQMAVDKLSIFWL